MQNFPNNIVPTSLYCNKYYTRCASACQCPSDGRSLTGQSTVPSTRVWRITSATRKTLWRLRAVATPSSATMAHVSGLPATISAEEPQRQMVPSIGASLAHRISRQPLLARKRSGRLICTPFTGHPVEGVLLCGTHMSTKGNV